MHFATAFSVAAAVLAVASASAYRTNNVADEKQTCADALDVDCFQLNIVNNLGRIMRKKSFQLLEGVELEQIPGREARGLGRSLNEDDLSENVYEREDQLDNLFGERLSQLFSSRSLKMSLDSFFPGMAVKIARSVDSNQSFNVEMEWPEGAKFLGDARTRGGLRRLGPIILLFAYKAIMGGAVVLAGVAKLAGLALLVSKLALFLSAILGLKKLTSHHNEYPQYTHVNIPSSHGYGRSMVDDVISHRGDKMAFRGQTEA